MISYRNIEMAIVVAALSLAAASASAAAAPASSLSTDIGKCSALPRSQRGICRELALNRAIAAMPVTPKSAAEQQRVAAANARYTNAMAACKRLPISQLNTCIDKAGAMRAETARPLSSAQQAAMRAENERYHAALASCNRLPLSQRYTCASLQGNDEWLSHHG